MMNFKMLKMKNLAIVILFLAASILLSSCEEEKIYESNLDEMQIVAKNLSGTWVSPREVRTPDDVPKSIISKLRLVFTVDENGMPDKFFSEGATDVFKSEAGTWSFVDNDVNKIQLEGIGPIAQFNIDTSVVNRLKLWFTTTWRDTDGNSGEGLFEVIMVRYGTE